MVLLCDLRNSERSILHNQSACKSLTLWGMKKAESPRRVRRRARLVLLLSECGGAAQVARETGTPKTYISAIVNGTRGLGDKLAAKFEHEYNKPEGWFDLSVDHAEAVQAPVVDAPSDQSLPVTMLSTEVIMLGDQLDRIKNKAARVLAMNEALTVVLDHCRRNQVA